MKEYIDTYHAAKYRGIIPYYYSTYQEEDYIISTRSNLSSSLPSCKNYQKTRKRTKEKIKLEKDGTNILNL